MTKRKLNVALIGYDFMGRVHSSAWRQVAHFFRDLPFDPVLKVVVGRTEAKVVEARDRLGFEGYATRWQDVMGRKEIDVVAIVSQGARAGEIAIPSAGGKKAV